MKPPAHFSGPVKWGGPAARLALLRSDLKAEARALAALNPHGRTYPARAAARMARVEALKASIAAHVAEFGDDAPKYL